MLRKIISRGSSASRYFCSDAGTLRLSKAVALSGMFSRREAEAMIRDGRVRVNFESTTTVTRKVSDEDKIFVDDIEIKSEVYSQKPRLFIVCVYHKHLKTNRCFTV
jgi:16S rRNA U516 pseudouridylate synthase RsuA-like enzyme